MKQRKLIHAVVISFIVALFISGCGMNNSDSGDQLGYATDKRLSEEERETLYKEALMNAEEAMSARSYEEAAEQYRLVIRYDANQDPLLYLDLAQAVLETGDLKETQRVLTDGYRNTGADMLRNPVLHARPNELIFSTYLSLAAEELNWRLSARHTSETSPQVLSATPREMGDVYTFPPAFMISICYEFHGDSLLVYDDWLLDGRTPPLLVSMDENGRAQQAELLSLAHAELLPEIDQRLFLELFDSDLENCLWQYSYDETGHLSEIDGRFDGNDATLLITRGNGWFKLSVERDGFEQELAQVFEDDLGQFLRASVGQTTLAQYTYTNAGCSISIGEHGYANENAIELDAFNRFDHIGFLYTPSGRLTNSLFDTFSYDLQDRLVSFSFENRSASDEYLIGKCVYNEFGALSCFEFNGERYLFEYDEQKRLGAINCEGEEDPRIRYSYDSKGRVIGVSGEHSGSDAVTRPVVWTKAGCIAAVVPVNDLLDEVVRPESYVLQGASGVEWCIDKSGWPSYISAVQIDDQALNTAVPGQYDVNFSIELSLEQYPLLAGLELADKSCFAQSTKNVEVISEEQLGELFVSHIQKGRGRLPAVLTDNGKAYPWPELSEQRQELYRYLMEEILDRGEYSIADGGWLVSRESEPPYVYHSFALSDLDGDGDEELILCADTTLPDDERYIPMDYCCVFIISRHSLTESGYPDQIEGYSLYRTFYTFMDYSNDYYQKLKLYDNKVFELSTDYCEFFFSPTNALVSNILSEQLGYPCHNNYSLCFYSKNDPVQLAFTFGMGGADSREISREEYQSLLSQLRGGENQILLHPLNEENVNQYLLFEK